jgi:hypothetical protein
LPVLKFLQAASDRNSRDNIRLSAVHSPTKREAC